MADKFLNLTAVQTIKTWATGLFAKDADLDALEAKVDEIISEGGEPNVIETVKVDGTALTPDAQKAVNIDLSGKADAADVPTKTSDLTNDGDGQSNFATEAYVDNNGGKIQKVKYDGTELPIDTTDKSVNVPKEVFVAEYNVTRGADIKQAVEDGKIIKVKYSASGALFTCIQVGINTSENLPEITVLNSNEEITYIISNQGEWTELSYLQLANSDSIPTAVSDLTNDSGYQTASDVQSAISSAVASAYKYKGSVATQSALPSSGQVVGDVWDVQDTGVNYAWTGTAWDALGSYVDTSVLWTSVTGQTNTLEAATVAEINAILNA